MFEARVLPAINAAQEVTPEEISEFDKIAAQVQMNA